MQAQLYTYSTVIPIPQHVYMHVDTNLFIFIWIVRIDADWNGVWVEEKRSKQQLLP